MNTLSSVSAVVWSTKQSLPAITTLHTDPLGILAYAMSRNGAAIIYVDTTHMLSLSTDYGTTFTTRETRIFPTNINIDNRFFSAAVSDDGNTIAVGQNGCTFSTDAGLTWNYQENCSKVSMSADGKFVIASSGTFSKRSDNYGAASSWANALVVPNIPTNMSGSGQYIYGCAQISIMKRCTDGTATTGPLTFVDPTGAIPQYPRIMSCSESGQFVVGHGADVKYLFYSSDYLATFTVLGPTSTIVKACNARFGGNERIFHCTDDGRMWGINNTYKIIVSSDNFASFPEYAPTVIGTNFSQLYVSATGKYILVWSTGNKLTLITDNTIS